MKSQQKKSKQPKTTQQKGSLLQVYFDEWELPFCCFLSVAVVMIFIGSTLANPVLKEAEVGMLMLLPGLSSLGIAIAAIVNLDKKKVAVGLANLLAFIVSLPCLLILLFWLCYIGMSY